MKKHRETLIIKVIPVLIGILLLKWTIESWWQLFDPFGYYYGCMDCRLPFIIILLKGILLTGIIALSLSASFGKRTGYLTIKWLLIISVPISLYFLFLHVPRLWDFQRVGLNLETWQTAEIPLTSQYRWIIIYNPILISFGVTSFIFISLWLWTRENIKSKFRRPIKSNLKNVFRKIKNKNYR